MTLEQHSPFSEFADVNPATPWRFAPETTPVSFIPMGDVSESGKWIANQTRPIEEVSSGYTAFQEDDLLFAKITPCMENGKGAHARNLTNELGFGTTEFHVLRTKPGNSARYLYFWLQAEITRIRAKGFMGGSAGQQRVQAEFFDHFRIPKFSSEEQSRIASVLDTVDALIDSSEAVVAKLRQVRAGLLHDLLTRGLDADGQLRDPDAHPDQFKDSPLGRIPREWEVKTLGDVVQFSSGGTPSRSNAQSWKGTLPFLTPKDMKVFAIGSTIEHLTEDAAIAGSKVMPAETAFIVVRGMILAHTFPVCLSLCRMAFNQDIKGMTGTEGISTRFLAHWLAANEDLFLRKTTEATHGTKKLDLKELEATLIAVPDETEQVQIVKLIEQSDRNLEAEQSELAKLRHLKSGLMTDLLEGRVRVSEDLTCEPARKSTAKGVDLQPR